MIENKELSILIIDDNKFMLQLVTTILQQAGYENLKTATHGRHALSIIDSCTDPIDILLCDLNMPKMDGIEFLRHLSLRNFSGAVILFSGEDKKLLEIAETLGKDHQLRILGSIQKPLDLKQFNQFVKASLETASSRAKLRSTIEVSPEQLQQGLNNDEIIPYFQPQVSTDTGRITGVEALARWQHPTFGLLSPHHFIELAEKNDLIESITKTTVKSTINQLKRWHQVGIKIHASVNFSMKLFNRLDLPEYLESLLGEAQLSHQTFVVELTESQVMDNFSVALEIISRLSLKRFQLSIDDFGTGYSSMQKLEQLPFNELKVDQQFIGHANDSPTAMAILESSLQLAQKLHLSTVVEGVENKKQWDLVKKLGCENVQGYYVSPPLPSEDFFEWVQQPKVRPQ